MKYRGNYKIFLFKITIKKSELNLDDSELYFSKEKTDQSRVNLEKE